MTKLAAAVALALVCAGAASATTPGTNGVVLFQQPRCPSYEIRGCRLAPQLCALDPSTGRSFVADLPLSASISPDGRRMAWYDPRTLKLLVASSDGSGARVLRAVDAVGPPPAWSPDGASIALDPLDGRPLEVVDASTGAARDLGTVAVAPSWAPDGSAIAASEWQSAGGFLIALVDPVTGASHDVTTEPSAGQPSDIAGDWSPDSRWIAFTRLGDALPARLQIVARDGTGRRDLGKGAYPAWAPDGTRIAFIRQGALWTTTPDGSDQRQLSAFPQVAYSQPRWLDAVQTATLVPAGRCDRLLTGSGVRYEGAGGMDTIYVAGDRDTVSGNAGNDAIWVVARQGATPHRELVEGGAGNDDVELQAAANVALGGLGNDTLVALGTNLPQRLSGGRGNDWVQGGSGDDTLAGGPGSDRLFSGPGSDHADGGPGRDAIHGGLGNDVIHSRDGYRDTIDCGPGRDVVYADRLDVVAGNCERVLRSR